MENEPQNNGGTPENDGWDGNSAQPKFTFENPDYEAWYPDQNKYESDESNYWRRQNVIAGLGLIINVLTFIGAVVGIYIAFNAFQASNRAVTEAKRQADEARRQANTAEAQILVAKETEIKQLRAYVMLDLSQSIKITPGNLTINIENFGETPAQNVHMYGYWEFVPYGEDLPQDFSFPDRPPPCAGPDGQKINPGVPILPPKNPIGASSYHCPEVLEQIIKSERKEINAFQYGHIEYTDIFGEHRRTNFCFLYYHPLQMAFLCDRHNEMDPQESAEQPTTAN